SDGTVDASGSLNLFRRGNTTFSGYDMKPYNINMSSPVSLLGMPAGTKWALKANAMDKTQLLRNELAFKSSRLCGLSPCPDTRYVNLYINGIYKGFYMLAQRINAKELMELTPGEYFMELDYRSEDTDCTLKADEPVVIHYPEAVSDEDLDFISNKYNEAKNAIINDTDLEKYLDIESFVKMYIIQDFFSQTDVDFGSFFFYYGKDGLFHAGPVWDFDLSCGMTAGDPYHEELTMKSRLFKAQKRPCVFLDLLDDNESFMELVQSYYLNEFDDMIMGYIGSDWENDLKYIAHSSDLSALANGTSETGNAAMDDPESLKAWVKGRSDYLKGYYLNPNEYAVVTYHFAWGVLADALKKGQPAGFLPDNEHPGNNEGFWGEITGFVDGNRVPVDKHFIPSKDMDLYAVYTEDSYAWEEYSLP
ncbi:MAG: CotH kinase family protein, partial [Lachnospiraceae bacterium]|nr:CotH kinase family protein [Lachnospiraceae bacterium]